MTSRCACLGQAMFPAYLRGPFGSIRNIAGARELMRPVRPMWIGRQRRSCMRAYVHCAKVEEHQRARKRMASAPNVDRTFPAVGLGPLTMIARAAVTAANQPDRQQCRHHT